MERHFHCNSVFYIITFGSIRFNGQWHKTFHAFILKPLFCSLSLCQTWTKETKVLILNLCRYCTRLLRNLAAVVVRMQRIPLEGHRDLGDRSVPEKWQKSNFSPIFKTGKE